MGANLIPAMGQVQADTAGMTSATPATPTTAPVQFSEILNGIGTEYGGLTSLFGGQSPAAIVNTAVTVPTDSIRGRLGGLVPQLSGLAAQPPAYDSVNDPGTVQQTYPGQVAADVANAPGGYANVGAAQVGAHLGAAVASVRSFLGI